MLLVVRIVLILPCSTLFFSIKKVENSAQPQALFRNILKSYYIGEENLSLDFLIPTFLLKKKPVNVSEY